LFKSIVRLFSFVLVSAYMCVFTPKAKAADNLMESRSSQLNLMLTPTLKDMLNVAKGDETPAIASKDELGGFSPYLGFYDTDPNKFLVPGQMLGMLGGISYFVRNSEGPGEYGFIFAVKDNVPNRFVGYSMDKSNLVPYFSFSISY
jgi:hypothetical protein